MDTFSGRRISEINHLSLDSIYIDDTFIIYMKTKLKEMNIEFINCFGINEWKMVSGDKLNDPVIKIIMGDLKVTIDKVGLIGLNETQLMLLGNEVLSVFNVLLSQMIKTMEKKND